MIKLVARVAVVLFLIFLFYLVQDINNESPIDRQIRRVEEKVAEVGWIDERKEKD